MATFTRVYTGPNVNLVECVLDAGDTDEDIPYDLAGPVIPIFLATTGGFFTQEVLLGPAGAGVMNCTKTAGAAAEFLAVFIQVNSKQIG